MNEIRHLMDKPAKFYPFMIVDLVSGRFPEKFALGGVTLVPYLIGYSYSLNNADGPRHG
jgi:hypothetical protein